MPQVEAMGLPGTDSRSRPAEQAGLWGDEPDEAADAHGEGPEAVDAAAPVPQEAAPEHNPEPEAEPEADALDWRSRKLLGQLYHAVVSHLEVTEQEPSDELHWLPMPK